MKYKKNNGSKTSIFGTTTINVEAGDKVEFYGNGTNITSYSGTKIAGGTAQCIVYGNIMSLVDEAHFPTATKVNKRAFSQLFENNTLLTDASGLVLPATTLAESCYEYMFSGCTSLTAAPALPATTLAESCYNQMFYGCTALTTASALPAMTMDVLSYNQMFYGCSALTTAPALPATKLAVECYFAMFQGCESLTAAPTLPATTLAESCYSNMFRDCTGLTAAPALPAATLVKGCYNRMFMGCKNLSAVTCLATDISATGCTEQWLEGVAETGVFTPADATVAWEIDSASGIPAGWNGGTPTGLNKVNANEEGTVVYDFMGRRVKNARRGMFIQNGKKIVKNW
jgi:hypothetical protein